VAANAEETRQEVKVIDSFEEHKQDSNMNEQKTP